MPREQMNEQQVAAYLNIDVREVAKLASRGQVPCRRIAGKFVFLKGDLDHWIEARMPQMDRKDLAGIEKGVGAHHGFDTVSEVVCPLIPDRGAAVPLDARTREAVIRRLVDLAEQAGLVYIRDELLGEIRQREELCSTAIMPGVALAHPRHPLPYDIAASFVVVGRTASGIPFGAEDGSLTRLFFLVCCKDDRTHLHVLARLALMLHEAGAIEELMAAEDAEQFLQTLHQRELAAIHKAR